MWTSVYVKNGFLCVSCDEDLILIDGEEFEVKGRFNNNPNMMCDALTMFAQKVHDILDNPEQYEKKYGEDIDFRDSASSVNIYTSTMDVYVIV